MLQLRGDVKSGDLSLNLFAADLYDVVMGNAPAIYQNPQDFFALTYPTYNLRELAKDVVGRLAGKNPKAVRQLELTYGGGKTHSLITLYHLVNDPAKLPNLPAVQEFLQHVGVTPPKTRIATIVFDKLDPETGMDVKSPDGKVRRFLYPWTVLAYQLGGEKALEILGMKGNVEREEPPFENVIGDILRLPMKENLSTLVLIDEVLMWARTKIGANEVWRHRIQDFFQCLTQAAVKINKCCIIASLLATDPKKSDSLGKEIAQELFAIFRRESEEGVSPVEKADVPEILRRRFFTPESQRNRESLRPQVSSLLAGIKDLDEQTKKEGKAAEDRFWNSYPFHPDLIDVFYTKWTNLEGFQRTRGVLRTFAIALREADKWDTSPLIGPIIFLGPPGANKLSEAANELASIAGLEEYEGKKHEWRGILDGEMGKAREIQADFTGLRHREVEQAVFITFLHSQPVGQKAASRDFFLLLGHTRPDKIELEKGLRQWANSSWFLDEALVNDTERGPNGERGLPKFWRLGSKPNLVQMHHDACNNISNDLITTKLNEEIQNLKGKIISTAEIKSGIKFHNLPQSPRDIPDDGEFHFVLLGPAAASHPGKPSDITKKFINETTGVDRPRVYRNAILLAVPSPDGLDGAKVKVRDYLGWEEVSSLLSLQGTVDAVGKKKGKKKQTQDTQKDAMALDPARKTIVVENINNTKSVIPDVIRQSYCIVVTVSKDNEMEAFKLAIGDDPLFSQIKTDARARIQESAISAEALLPEGPYNLWRKGETSRRVKDLVYAFAQFPHLPKMLNRRAIAETIADGCRKGHFVLRLVRPDSSIRTIWMQPVDEEALANPGLELILPQAASLSDLPAKLLLPNQLPDLWPGEELSLKDITSYFSGGKVAKLKMENYEEPFIVPKVERSIIETVLRDAVKQGHLLLISGSLSFCKEEAPQDALVENARLRVPPSISMNAILPENLPNAWQDGSSNIQAIVTLLSEKIGYPIPWTIMLDLINSGLRGRVIELLPEAKDNWPCEFITAKDILLRIPAKKVSPPKPPSGGGVIITSEPSIKVVSAEGSFDANDIQNLADNISDIKLSTVGYKSDVTIRLEVRGNPTLPDELMHKLNEILKKVKDGFQLQ